MPPVSLQGLKPAARARSHLLAAATLWTLVGGSLATAGLCWCAAPAWPRPVALAALACALGYAKARWILSRVARRNARRIVERGDDRCLGGFVSWKGWLGILVMMSCGYALRNSPVPRAVLGVVYGAVGIALLIASSLLWRAWRLARTPIET